MELKLTRQKSTEDGVFSILTKDGTAIAYTLEHAYPTESGLYCAKIPLGTFTCVRGQHQLHSMTHPFTTFEVTNVSGHSNLLFHVGNYNSDSDGCILLGSSMFYDVDNGREMIIHSRDSFDKFMEMMVGIDSFTLVVV